MKVILRGHDGEPGEGKVGSASRGFGVTATMSLGSSIRFLREARQLGLRRFAAATGLSPSYLSRIERDCVPPPSAEIIERIAAALRTDADDLLAAAGLLPRSVLTLIQSRPATIKKIASLVDGLTDDQVDALCDAWRRRVPSLPQETASPLRS